MKCPGCGENNEAGMQFCIFCGNSLSIASTPAVTAVPTLMPPLEDFQSVARQSSASQALVLVCTVCSKTDPLNGQFCVYCGGRTVAGSPPSPAPISYGSTSQSLPPVGLASGTYASAEGQRLSEELVRAAPPKKVSKSSGFGVLAILLGLILGAGLAAGAVYFFRDSLQKSAVNSLWPDEGLLIYSKAANADLTVTDIKRRSLIFGTTATDGNIYLPSISPGSYSVKINDDKGKELKTEVSINLGDCSVVGYPQRLELK